MLVAHAFLPESGIAYAFRLGPRNLVRIALFGHGNQSACQRQPKLVEGGVHYGALRNRLWVESQGPYPNKWWKLLRLCTSRKSSSMLKFHQHPQKLYCEPIRLDCRTPRPEATSDVNAARSNSALCLHSEQYPDSDVHVYRCTVFGDPALKPNPAWTGQIGV